MSLELTPWARRLGHPLGLLLVVLAFVSQLALGGMVLPDGPTVQQAAELDAISVICRGGAPAPHRPRSSHGEHRTGWALCPLNVAMALPSIVLSPAPLLWLPSGTSGVWFGSALRARGPPSRLWRASSARGPPVLS